MRLSRLVTKERISETLEDILESHDIFAQAALTALTDGMYELLSELDTEDDLGFLKEDEDAESE